MSEEIILPKQERPTRLVYNPETGERYNEYVSWVDPKGKTVKQVLLEIADELNSRYWNDRNVNELLSQAIGLVHKYIPNADKNIMFGKLMQQQRILTEYSRQSSKRKKDQLLNDVIKEAQYAIRDYY